MRAWKLYKGMMAYLAVLISVVFLRAEILWSGGTAKPAIRPEAQKVSDDSGPWSPAKSEVPRMNDPRMPPPIPPTKLGTPPSAPEEQFPPGPPLEPQEPFLRDDSFPPMPSEQDFAAPPPQFAPQAPMNMPPSRNIGGNVAPSRRPPQAPPRTSTRSRNRAGNNPNEADIYKVVPKTCVPAKGKFIWNFEEEELINILRQASDLKCETIVVHSMIDKNMKMTIIGKTLLTPDDAWDILMASLAAKGMAMVQQGKTWTVIKRNESKSYPTPMYFDGKEARNNEEVGTFFYKPQHASQEALKNIARVLISKDGMVEGIGDQFIIIIDSNANIRRLGTIFAQVDIEDAINKIHVINLEHADAKTVEKQLRDIFDVQSGGGGPSGRPRRRRATSESKTILEIDKIIADERTNRLLVVADKDSIDKLKEIVALVDQPSSDQGNKGKVHVKKLKFGDAKKISETLANVVQQGKSSRFRRRSEEGSHELFESEVKITPHESTNSLVLVATPNDYRSLLATINELDVRQDQIYVEAVILDISVNDTNQFGINLFGGLDPNWLGGSLGIAANPGGKAMAENLKTGLAAGAAGTNITGLGNHGLGAMAVLGNFLVGGVAGVVGPPIGNTQIPSFGAVLQALSTNSQVDVLSTPYLLTTNNQQAEMSVGEKVPVVRGASTLGGGGLGAGLGVPLQNVAYEDVKLTFKITPHVGDEGNVRLDIEQEVNELGNEELLLNAKQYRIRTKSAKTTLVLRDQQTGVIGGLIDHKSTKIDTKVPFLGDIPLLGWLFKNRESKNDRRSLLLIITPYIIRTDEDYKKIVERKLKERKEFAEYYYGGKIREYNKHIDYSRKEGPLSNLFLQLDAEMSKAENGGPGDGNETIITPKQTNPKENQLPEKARESIPLPKPENPPQSDIQFDSSHDGAAFYGGGGNDLPAAPLEGSEDLFRDNFVTKKHEETMIPEEEIDEEGLETLPQNDFSR